jgi:hypothetical protein
MAVLLAVIRWTPAFPVTDWAYGRPARRKNHKSLSNIARETLVRPLPASKIVPKVSLPPLTLCSGRRTPIRHNCFSTLLVITARRKLSRMIEALAAARSRCCRSRCYRYALRRGRVRSRHSDVKPLVVVNLREARLAKIPASPRRSGRSSRQVPRLPRPIFKERHICEFERRNKIIRPITATRIHFKDIFQISEALPQRNLI